MNFKHLAIKTFCKRMLLDHRAQPRFLEFDTERHELQEALIDIFRLTTKSHRFSIVFEVDDITLRFTMIFGYKSDVDQFEGFTRGREEQTVSVAYPKDFNGIDGIYIEDVIDEILCHAESKWIREIEV